ncbi:MAG: hypothetical protein LHV68_04815 [Elusimicrobia bacterium]|nr:hypothetical protein [Candidatus Liberimonas magnetica]
MKNRISLSLAFLLLLNSALYSKSGNPSFVSTSAGTTYNSRPFILFTATAGSGNINDARVVITGATSITYRYKDSINCFKNMCGSGVNITFRPSGALTAGSNTFTVYTYDSGANQTEAQRQCTTAAAVSITVAALPAWTDNPTVTAGTTQAKVAHLTELRTRIDTVRAVRGLAAYGYTRTPVAGNIIQATDFNDTRTALNQAVNAATGTNITYVANPTISSGGATVIKAGDINEMRTAVSIP